MRGSPPQAKAAADSGWVVPGDQHTLGIVTLGNGSGLPRKNYVPVQFEGVKRRSVK